MACPTCGSDQRRPIAPGFWECVGTVTDRVGGPGLTNPQAGPAVLETQRACGTRYHEQDGAAGTPIAACACGTFAIGICVDCGVPVCGDHSRIANGGRRCRDHVQAAAIAEAQARQAATEQRQREQAEQFERERQERAERAAAERERSLLARDQVQRALASLKAAGCPGAEEVQLVGWRYPRGLRKVLAGGSMVRASRTLRAWQLSETVRKISLGHRGEESVTLTTWVSEDQHYFHLLDGRYNSLHQPVHLAPSGPESALDKQLELLQGGGPADCQAGPFNLSTRWPELPELTWPRVLGTLRRHLPS